MSTDRDAGASVAVVEQPGRRYDPQRRDRIIDACLDVIAAVGVAGTSHRKVAEAADVPLGSMTYHFAGMGELLHEAFSRFATSFSDRFAARMAAAVDREAAVAAIIEAVEGDILNDQRELVLTQELYTLAARDPSFRDLTNAWMGRSRAALERHFDPTTARMVDALIEGLTLHRALDNEPQDGAVVRAAVARLTAVTPPDNTTDSPGETP
jgi:DNA-binding transcriptional regulator YbjK